MRKLLVSLVAVWACVPAKGDTCGTLPCTETRENAGRDTPVLDASAPVGFCGDGVWDPEREQCDDGASCRDGRDCTHDRLRCQATSVNACQPRANDGCSEQCTVESGYACPQGTDCRPLPACSAGDGGACGTSTESSSGASGMTPVSSQDPPVDAPDWGSPMVRATPVTGEPLAPPSREERCRTWSFESPERLSGLDASLFLWAPALASDGRTLFFAGSLSGPLERIYFATREGRGSRFSEPALLANVGSGSGDGTPLLSHDGRTLYFYSRRPGGNGDRDLWFSTRADAAAEFGAPSLLPGVNSSAIDHLPWLTADELTLLYVSTRAGGSGASDVWMARRGSRAQSFGDPELFTAVSSSADEGRTSVSSDGAALFFSSNREGGQGGQDLWFTQLGDDEIQFEAPINLSDLNSASQELDPFFSGDERELFFASNRSGRWELWRSLVDCDD